MNTIRSTALPQTIVNPLSDYHHHCSRIVEQCFWIPSQSLLRSGSISLKVTSCCKLDFKGDANVSKGSLSHPLASK